jgi:hypothetical protein
MRAGRLVLFQVVVVLTTACDRTPVGLPEESELAPIEALTGVSPAPLTLSGLVSSAIRTVHVEHGVNAADDLVRDLAGIQRRLDAGSVTERPALRRELRSEQLRIVFLVHGDDVVASTIRGVADAAAELQRRRDALSASGIAAPEIGSVLEDVPALLDRARNAASSVEALDAVTRASARTERLRHVVAGAARLPSLNDLVSTAADRLAASGQRDVVIESLVLDAAASDAVEAGDRDRAHAATEAAREAQIRIVLAGLGPDAVADAIGSARDAVGEQVHRLAETSAGRDVSRLERMNETAADMLQRADLHLRRGDSAAALDLACHAIDLLNAIDAAISTL